MHPLVRQQLRTVRKPRFHNIPRQQQPDRQREEYFAAVAPMVEELFEDVRKDLIPALPDIVREAGFRQDSATVLERVSWDAIGRHRQRLDAADVQWWDEPAVADELRRAVRQDNWSGRLEQILRDIAERYVHRFPASRLSALSHRVARITSDFQRKQLLRQFRHAFGVDPFLNEPWLAEEADRWTGENVKLIKSIPADALDDLAARINAGVRQGKRHEELAKEIEARHDVTKRRAALIARDQTAKWYSDLNRHRQKELGVDSYIHTTMNDNRVCEICDPLDGQTFEWANPPAQGTPGNCHPDDRCVAEPALQSYWDSLGDDSVTDG
jgi:SPP1 gp7 family putative phage head morphogenesis protein